MAAPGQLAGRLMRTSGTSVRPLSRGIIHVCDRPRRSPSASSPARPGTGASSGRPTSSAPRTTRRSSPPPGRSRVGRSSTATARSSPATRRTRTASCTASTPSTAISHVVGYASRRYGTAGLERAFDAELSGLAGDPLADAFRKFGTTPYDPKDLTLSLSYDLQRAAVRALGKDRGADRHARSAHGRGPRHGLDADVRRLGHRGPGHGRRDVRGAHRRQGPATAPAGDPGPLRAGLGVQDRDGGRRPRVRGGHACDDLQGAAQGGEGRPPRRRLPDPRRPSPPDRQRRPSTSSRRPRCPATSGTPSPVSRPAAPT